MKYYFVILIAGISFFSACQPAVGTDDSRVETPAMPVESSAEPAGTAKGETAQPTIPTQPQLASIDPDSPLCAVAQDNLLIPICEDGALTVSRAQDPRRVDLFLNRDVAFNADAISIQASAASHPPEGEALDHNQYGVYFVDGSGVYHALRISGQYLNFETWGLNEDLAVEDRYNRVFSPTLKPAGENNLFRLNCGDATCDLFINSQLAGRVPAAANGSITRVGVFTAANWDQVFGRVTFDGFEFNEIPSGQPESQTFSLMDDLSADHGTFSKVGLSGAFSAYDDDGFHFSPVVPYNFYWARTEPSLANVSVEATVMMEIEPGVSGSQLGGVACRASQEGAYMAVIKVDGTYTLFRDTPRRPLAVLARKASDAILPGRTENTIRLDCHGDQIDFYINGTQVVSITDTRFNVSFGRTGLVTKAGGSPDVDAIIFRDLSIQELR